MEDFYKVVRLGITEVYDNKFVSVYCSIKFKDGKLSICGVEGPMPNGNAHGACGQITIDRPKIKNLASGWTYGQLHYFWRVWKTWHLNDMQAECKHQRARGETWVTHPSAICPDCGYSLGSKWLRMEVPENVLEFLKNLPNTDKTPAWV